MQNWALPYIYTYRYTLFIEAAQETKDVAQERRKQTLGHRLIEKKGGHRHDSPSSIILE
jgi:hypothetical protein